MGKDGRKTDAETRAEKLAEALRANLHRRKSQTRLRKSAETKDTKAEKPAPRR